MAPDIVARAAPHLQAEYPIATGVFILLGVVLESAPYGLCCEIF